MFQLTYYDYLHYSAVSIYIREAFPHAETSGLDFNTLVSTSTEAYKNKVDAAQFVFQDKNDVPTRTIELVLHERYVLLVSCMIYSNCIDRLDSSQGWLLS